jgi:plastocyanin
MRAVRTVTFRRVAVPARVRAAYWLLPAAAVLLLTACAASAGPPLPTPSAVPLPSGEPVLSVVAHNSKFDVSELRVPAGAPFAVLLRNEDRDVHNFELRDAAGRSIFRGELFGGPAERLEALPAVEPGTYQFLCTAHPYMKGTLLAD